MRLSRQEQIAKLKNAREERAAKAAEADKRDADRLRFLEVKQAAVERKRDTRRKIVLGSMVLAARESETEVSLAWFEEQIQALKRPHDRRLFGLEETPAADNGTTPAEETVDSPDPITDQRKDLLATLVTDHPKLALEIGINPDKPELEQLSKTKATQLIGAVGDQLPKPQEPIGGWKPRRVGKDWGAALKGPEVALLPKELSGIQITVTAASTGKSWTATIEEVVSRSEDLVVVLDSERSKRS